MDVQILAYITTYGLGVKRPGQAQKGQSTRAQLFWALHRPCHLFLQTHLEAGQSIALGFPHLAYAVSETTVLQEKSTAP